MSDTTRQATVYFSDWITNRLAGRVPVSDGFHPGDFFLIQSEFVEIEGPYAEDEAALAEIWRYFNADDRPNGSYQRSLSVGDVIYLEGTVYAIESVGFRRLTEDEYQSIRVAA